MVPLLEPEHPTYVGDLLTLVESVLENPEIVLRKQTDRAKQAALAEMKSQGVQYEERMEKLEGISYPKPLADWLFGNFDRFARMHPWVGDREIAPKSIGREMWETYASFNDYVKAYGLERSEGVLLRYLSQLYRTLQQNVPIVAKTEAVEDVLGFFRTTIELTDTSLLEEWESMLHPELLLREARGAREGGRGDLGARAGREPEGVRGPRALGDAPLRAGARKPELGRGADPHRPFSCRGAGEAAVRRRRVGCGAVSKRRSRRSSRSTPTSSPRRRAGATTGPRSVRSATASGRCSRP